MFSGNNLCSKKLLFGNLYKDTCKYRYSYNGNMINTWSKFLVAQEWSLLKFLKGWTHFCTLQILLSLIIWLGSINLKWFNKIMSWFFFYVAVWKVLIKRKQLAMILMLKLMTLLRLKWTTFCCLLPANKKYR